MNNKVIEICLPARAGYLLFAALAFLAYLAVKGPKHNEDMIGYVASAYSYQGLEGRALLEKTYEDVRATADEARFWHITQRDDEHRTMYLDPVSLEQRTIIFKTRVIYILSVIAASFFTDTMSAATHVVSAVSGVIILLLLSGLLLRSRLTVFLLFPLALAAAGLAPLSAYSTPDMLAAMTAIAIACVGLRAPRPAIWLLPILPAVRPDYILIAPLFAWVLYRREHRLEAMVSVALAVIVYCAINRWFNNYGYLTHFNLTLIQVFHPYPLDMPISSHSKDYVDAYLNGVRNLFLRPSMAVCTAIIALGATLAASSGASLKRSIAGFAVAATVFSLSHFMLFPIGLYRFYFVATALSLVVIFTSIGRAKLNLPP